MQSDNYKIINITQENIAQYGMFCQKSKQKEEGYQSKLEWILERFKEGLKYKLLLVEERGKLTSRGFIEYIPGEYCWRGLEAKGYMVIHCIWVVGQHKGKGYGSKLLKECLKDAKRMKGVAVMTAKTTWLPKSKLFIKHGFEKIDSYHPYFELYVLKNDLSADLPRFKENKVQNKENIFQGFEIYSSAQCPYTPAMVNSIERYAKIENLCVKKISIKTCYEAQNLVHPYGTSCYLLDGEVLTYHSDNVRKLIENKRKQ